MYNCIHMYTLLHFPAAGRYTRDQVSGASFPSAYVRCQRTVKVRPSRSDRQGRGSVAEDQRRDSRSLHHRDFEVFHEVFYHVIDAEMFHHFIIETPRCSTGCFTTSIDVEMFHHLITGTSRCSTRCFTTSLTPRCSITSS